MCGKKGNKFVNYKLKLKLQVSRRNRHRFKRRSMKILELKRAVSYESASSLMSNFMGILRNGIHVKI